MTSPGFLTCMTPFCRLHTRPQQAHPFVMMSRARPTKLKPLAMSANSALYEYVTATPIWFATSSKMVFQFTVPTYEIVT